MKEPGLATDGDAGQYSNPPGYDLKLFDITETLFKVLGFVFDADELGKWIYDVVVSKHGPRTLIADMARTFWRVLIQLDTNINRSKESWESIRAPEDLDVVEDFIISGRRQISKLQRLLSACERSMLGLLSEGSSGSGIDFVETLYNRDVMLKDTERFVEGLELWIRRWKDNCEPNLPERKR